MTTNPGTRLGPYEIISRIGAGGMGEVFKARDTRLDRSVAIKVLPGEFAKNAQLRLRFEREAKAISQLNHPHICTLYDVGDDYLVMELLEGETLADRLARGPLPLADVLRLGAQIADALDRAHRAGIVHRDLKPGNIMLTKAGAKLLDFGLAKTAAQQITPNDETARHDRTLTQEGTILGTFQYMAPEQLEAEEADARTDIFALGAVLYEMCTGKRAFEGKTKTSLIAAIVGSSPRPLSQVVPLSPAALDHVIQKCLEKERDDRWQSAHDIAEELRWIATVPVTQAEGNSRVTRLAVAAAVALVLALAAVTALWVRARNTPRPRVSFSVLPPRGYFFGVRTLAPDGSAIAFGAANEKNEGGIFIRRLDEVEAKRLTDSPEDILVTWSADSRSLLYISDRQGLRQLRKISVSGGTPEVLARQFGSIGGATASPDGTLLFNARFGEGLQALRPGAADPVTITKLDTQRRESVHTGPRFLSDGKRFLYVSHTIAERKNEIWAGSLDGKVRKMIMRADTLVGLALGNLCFVNDGAIYAQEFDEDDLSLRGTPRRITDGVFFSEPSVVGDAWIARDGSLLYQPIQERTSDISWYDRNGRKIETVLRAPLISGLWLSHDGTKLAATRWDHVKGANDIVIIDLVRGIQSKLTSGLAHHDTAIWDHDDSRVFFVSDREGAYDIYAQPDDGATPAVPIWKSPFDKGLSDVSPDGTILLANEFNGKTKGDIYLVPVDAPDKRRPFVATDANEHSAQFSPDGKWIAYTSDQSGRRELYMRRVDGKRSIQITAQGMSGYCWRNDGSEFYARTLTNDRVAIPVTYQGETVIPGKATPLFSPPAIDYGFIAATDKGFLIRSVPNPSDYISVLHYDSAPLDRR